ncbi:MAG: MarC family transcriptional regulator [Candidatus Methanoperedenaceae archaeon]|nr:MAG: MarC family transcriptional regulator [Candidatus Methanoperedenaceae archaeon]
MTSELTFFVSVFTAIFSIVNPVSGVMAFISMTANMKDEDKNYVAKRSVVIACIIAILFTISGNNIMGFFSITVDSLRVAGGILLFLVAMDMLFARTTRESITSEELSDAVQRENVSIFPIAMPMLTGPGAITTIILFITKGVEEYNISLETVKLFEIAAILLTFIITYLIFRFSDYFRKVVGMTGMLVMTRLMGLFLGAMAVGFISDGIWNIYKLKLMG